jgi:hypothetical protein
MRVAICALVSVGLVTSFAATSDAASNRGKKKHRTTATYSRAYAPPGAITREQKLRNLRAYERGEYYEMDSNALPVGSKAWFEQKEREDGCC